MNSAAVQRLSRTGGVRRHGTKGVDGFDNPVEAIVTFALTRGQWEYVVAELQAA